MGKANASLRLDQWQNALRASEAALKIKTDDEKALFRKAQALEGLGRTDEALETLEEVEQIAEDLEDEFKEAIMADVNERREEIKDIERKAGREFKKMFKAMGDKNVFSGGRFLPDGTSPPPALTGDQERKLKAMKDKQEYMDAKAKHEMLQRQKEGKPLVEKPKEPDMPTPNKPALAGYSRMIRTRTITKAQAEELLGEMLVAYSVEDFQNKVHKDAKGVMYEHEPFIRRLKKTAFKVQSPVLAKWGFDVSEEGLNEMMICLYDHTVKDKNLRKLADETTMMLYGGEDGMWGMDDA